MLNTLDELRFRPLGEVTGMEYCPAPYKKGNTPPADDWMPYTSDMPLHGHNSHYWIRTSFTTPSVADHESVVLRVLTGKEGLADATNPQGLLYLNGKMVQGLDTNHTDAYLEPNTHYDLVNYFYIGMIRDTVHCKMLLFALDEQTEQLYYDVKVPFDACMTMSPESDAYIKMMSPLSDVTRVIDFRDPTSEQYRASVQKAIDFMATEFYGKLCTSEGKPVVHAIGHTHIDVEWKWDRAQTREKMQRSFATAKTLMDRYPEYKFTLSQPELYRYLKEEAPEKYEELRQLVKEGRWEPEGSMYLEADCNLTSGESLVRQILHGKRFFKEEFGVENKVLFLPDVFGYSAALPQILKKSGVDYFVTSKISWNDTNLMPKDAFYWEGIDGTSIFTSFITTQDFGGMKNKRKNFTTYVGHMTPSEVRGTHDRFRQREYSTHTMTTYGFGDGGGGPTKEMLEVQRRLAKGLPDMPVTKTDFLVPYLETLKSDFDRTCERTARTPKWVGELYLEYHRGTYTSVAKVKKGNRKSEFLLANAEALSATDLYFGGSYDQNGLNAFWRKVLHNQFHDILPGSSVVEVYDRTDVDYAQIAEYGTGVIDEKLKALAARVNTAGGTLIYNPTSFDRKVSLPINGTYCELDKTVPAFGWTVIRDVAPACRVCVNGNTVENDFYVMTLNELGQISSLYDKRAGREVFKKGQMGNLLYVLDDHPVKYDAWEIEDHAQYKRWTVDTEATLTPVTDGTRAGICIERKYFHSTIKQTVWLYSDDARIDFDNEIDWQDPHQILKAEFPLDVHAMSATYDVQFGHVTRPTHANTSWDEAKFEIYAHKWVDVAEHGYGVALLNDCKYGHSILGSTLALTLLKCPTAPYEKADRGLHTFTYSLLPHVGDFRDAGVIAESWALNQPLMSTPVSAHGGILDETFSYVSCDADNIVISALKKAENDDGLIVRMYDAFDCKSTVKVKIPEGFSKAYLCDLLEREQSELAVTDGTVTLPVSNFEIVTLKLTK